MQTIHIDISNKGVIPTIYAKQGDVGRKFRVVFTDAGVPYNIPSSALFSAWYSGDSGEGNYTEIGEKSAFSVNENSVEVEMVTQMLSVHGDGELCLVLADEQYQIGSWNIPYICEEKPGADSDEAKEYYNAFSEIVDAAKKFTTDTTLSVGGRPADAAETGRQLSVERARIDNIVALPEGSTTGDAELMDIRIGDDGVEYASAGSAVRCQIANINSAFDGVPIGNIINPVNSESGSFSTKSENLVSGKELTPIVFNGRTRSIKPIPIIGGTKYLYIRTSIKEDTSDTSIYIYFLEENKGYISKNGDGIRFSSVINKGSIEINVPDDCSYIHMVVGGESTGHDFSKVCISYEELADFESFGNKKEMTLKQSALPQKIAPTNGLKMLVFGDSITETADMTDKGGDYNPNFRMNWPVVAQEILQLDSIRNYAKSGATCRDTGYERIDGELKPKNDDVLYRMNLSEQVDLAISDEYYTDTPDIIVISIGTNDTVAIVDHPEESRDTYEDAMNIKSLESLKDDDNYEERTTMHKALRYAMWTLREKYPDAKCFIATPIQRESKEIPKYTRDAIVAMGNRYDFKVIDAYSESGIVRETCNPVKTSDGQNDPLEVDSQFDLYDGLHPSKKGSIKIAKLYSSVILSAYLGDDFYNV